MLSQIFSSSVVKCIPGTCCDALQACVEGKGGVQQRQPLHGCHQKGPEGNRNIWQISALSCSVWTPSCFQVGWHILEHILKPREVENLCSHMDERTRYRRQLAPNSPSHLRSASCVIIYCIVKHNLWHLWHFSTDILINGLYYVCAYWSWLI